MTTQNSNKCPRQIFFDFYDSTKSKKPRVPENPHKEKPRKPRARELKETTVWTPLPSIVSTGYKSYHTYVNWEHYENMWKLFALNTYFIRDNHPTRQQAKDQKDLQAAIEEAGNANFKTKRLDAQQIINNLVHSRNSGKYFRYGQNVIAAAATADATNPTAGLAALGVKICTTSDKHNADHLWQIMTKTRIIYHDLIKRYGQNTR
ncbi:MAG: hypothetical protein ILP11_01060 [Alphaproteobacteria bacterium]|nr:hypothetical protein [Alphaproteobacteria bacterium]